MVEQRLGKGADDADLMSNMMLALSLKGEIYNFSPRRTLAHMRTVTSAFQARNLASRTVRRSRRSQVRLKATSPPSPRKSERAEI